jgi:hypothetical protein
MGRPHGARSAPAELLFETAAEHFATDLSLEKA